MPAISATERQDPQRCRALEEQLPEGTGAGQYGDHRTRDHGAPLAQHRGGQCGSQREMETADGPESHEAWRDDQDLRTQPTGQRRPGQE
ncbi:hypothetical protein [Streptomyces sp. enrichment culture]|uniref:hypothetical protein n=1 Tax=Streptomyces sp. enrichment culture TaxID=1795815 RepID=UPI003F56B363